MPSVALLQPNPDALEKVVNEVKKVHIEAKQRAKGITSDGNTPNSTSRPCESIYMCTSIMWVSEAHFFLQV